MRKIIFYSVILALLMCCGCTKNEPIEEPTSTYVTEETIEPTTTEVQQIEIEEKEKLNNDYKIRNEASENKQLENSFDNIIEITGSTD